MRLPKQVLVREVGPRDGFQMEKAFVPTQTKIDIINQLSACGFAEIQATAFVHPKAVPNLADAAEVCEKISRNPAIDYSALIPNDKGYQRAAQAGMAKVELTLSATDSHNKNNMNATTDQSLDRLQACLDLGLDLPVVPGIAVAFHCPFEGRTPLDRLSYVVDRIAAMGLNEIALGDTCGAADPVQVYSYVSHLLDKHPGMTILLHLHNTFGNAMANVLAGMQAGVTMFDASIAGLGGCPYAPGATGNLATEDLVQTLHAMDIQTGIDLDRLVKVSAGVAQAVGHHDSSILRAGRTLNDAYSECAG